MSNQSSHKETIVIGAGPAGYSAAIRASQLGQKVTVIEKTYIGGTCLNVGCIPSKALITAAHRFHNAQSSEVFGVKSGAVSIDLDAMQKWKNEEVVAKLTNGVRGLLKKNKVEIIEGKATFKNNKTLQVDTEKETMELTFDQIILATGTTMASLEEIPFGDRVLSTTDALNVTEVPESITVVGGGGYIGSQLAAAFSNLGSKVTILEKEDRILSFFDKDMADLVHKKYTKKGIDIVTGVTTKKVETSDTDTTITYEKDGKELTVHSSVALVTVGRIPVVTTLGLDQTEVELDAEGRVKVNDHLQTTVEGIYAIGDIVPGTMLADEGMYHGKLVAESIAQGNKNVVAKKVVPKSIYTEPELATVGMSADEAKKAGKRYKASKFPLAANGRALSLNEAEGFVRLITDEEAGGQIVGAQLAGPSSADLSCLLALSIESGQVAEDVALTIQGHPSIGEAIMDAAELAMGMPIHM
ncbi:dihydrolipoyl dehydrogenase [Lacticigenium naphthae]|uniref:dihydrolipoyl dehydrogenase n=1 Tax=Lacticigenium naphthae TaxID=515351 RepID=UPI0004282211|nr:dihydrolipoyl dehydrogenase [Lacticigenium naphthae]